MTVHGSIERPHSPEAAPTDLSTLSTPPRRRGAHCPRWSAARLVAWATGTLAVVLCAALATGVVTAGSADAVARSADVSVTGRVCGPGHPPAGWIRYDGNAGDRGTVRTGRGWYAMRLHRVGRHGEWVSGTAYCPAPWPMAHIRAVRFGFFVPPVPVVRRDIR